MRLQPESPDDPSRRKAEIKKYAKSKFTVEELKQYGKTVKIVCVSELEPWAGNQKLSYWQEYEVPVEDAVMLDERRFAVILLSEKKTENKTNKKESK